MQSTKTVVSYCHLMKNQKSKLNFIPVTMILNPNYDVVILFGYSTSNHKVYFITKTTVAMKNKPVLQFLIRSLIQVCYL